MQLMVLILFAVVILSGLTMVYTGLRHHRSMPWLGIVHGLVAVAGFSLLMLAIFNGTSSKLINFAALMFFLALTGGGLLFALRERDAPPSMPLVTIHAVLALAGFGLLLAGAM